MFYEILLCLNLNSQYNHTLYFEAIFILFIYFKRFCMCSFNIITIHCISHLINSLLFWFCSFNSLKSFIQNSYIASHRIVNELWWCRWTSLNMGKFVIRSQRINKSICMYCVLHNVGLGSINIMRFKVILRFIQSYLLNGTN